MSSETIFITCQNCKAKQSVSNNAHICKCRFCGAEIKYTVTVEPFEQKDETITTNQGQSKRVTDSHSLIPGTVHDLIMNARSEIKSKVFASDRPSKWSYDRIPTSDPNYGEVLVAKSLISLTDMDSIFDYHFDVACSYLNQGLAFGVIDEEIKDYLLINIAVLTDALITKFAEKIIEVLKVIKNEHDSETLTEEVANELSQIIEKATEVFEVKFDPHILKIYSVIWDKLPKPEIALSINHSRGMINDTLFIDKEVRQGFIARFDQLYIKILRDFPQLDTVDRYHK